MPKPRMKAVQSATILSNTVSSKSVRKSNIATPSGRAQASKAGVGVKRSKTSKTSKTPKAIKNAESSNMAHASTKSDKPKFSHTNDVQLCAMVEWLEIPANYKIISGQATIGRSVAHGVGVTKMEGFGRMAKYVHSKALEHMHAQERVDEHHVQQWSPAVCQSRWTSHFKRYTKPRDQLNNQTGFGLTEEMRAQGVTLRVMVEKSCPYYYRINEVFGEQANVEPLSHTTIPEQEDDDFDRDGENDASLPGNDDVSRTPDADSDTLTHDTAQELPSLDELQLIDPDLLPPPATAEPDVPIHGRAAATTTRTSRSHGTLPSLASSDKSQSILRGDAKGVDKANNAKRRDFASVYTDASNKRLEFSAKRLKKDLALKEQQLKQDNHFRRLELEQRERDRLQLAADKKAEEKNRMALQLLLNGKSIEEVTAILAVFFPA